MTRGILIAGNESSLFTAAANEAAKRVQSFACAIIPNRFTTGNSASPQPEESKPESGAISLSWNPASAISARTLVLAAENRLKKIDDAVLICMPPAVYKTADALTPREIEILVDDHIKGWFFLIRELVLYFRNAGSGVLALVAPEISAVGDKKSKNTQNTSGQLDLLGPPAVASFQSYCRSIVASSVNEPYKVMGFSSPGAGVEEEFAAWLFKIVDEASPKNAGVWHSYTKRGFLGFS